MDMSARIGQCGLMWFRVAVGLIVLAACTTDDRQVAGTSTSSTSTSTTSTTLDAALVAAPAVVASAQTLCDGSIQELAAPPQGYETIGDSIALELGDAFPKPLPRDGDPALRLFTKTGLLVRTDSVTELIVPDGSAGHLAFLWNVRQPTTHLVVGPCSGPSNWIAFPGGFYVSETGCFSFIVRAKDGDHDVSVGLGSPCPGQTPPVGYTES